MHKLVLGEEWTPWERKEDKKDKKKEEGVKEESRGEEKGWSNFLFTLFSDCKLNTNKNQRIVWNLGRILLMRYFTLTFIVV